MATIPYAEVLEAVEQLTPEERRRLQEALAELQTSSNVSSSPGQLTGAALVAVLDAQSSDPVAWEEIGRIIEDECERIDSDTW
jgi:hypothetical protein